MTEALYFDDPLCLEFQAEITEIFMDNQGKFSAIMPRTYFYPTGGGQDHDTGWIGSAEVVDVYKDEMGRIVHTLDRAIEPRVYPARIEKRVVFRICKLTQPNIS